MLEAPLFCEAKKLSERQPFMAGRRSHTHKHTFMATKTITITEDAYRLLAIEKNKDESFSELVKREFGKRGKISDLYGTLNDVTEREHKMILSGIERSREISRKIEKEEMKKNETS